MLGKLEEYTEIKNKENKDYWLSYEYPILKNIYLSNVIEKMIK